jgi:hypothetical protein
VSPDATGGARRLIAALLQGALALPLLAAAADGREPLPRAESREALRRADGREPPGRALARGRCAITLSLPAGALVAGGAATLVAGETATLVGQLTCPLAAQAAAQTVQLEQHVAGTPGFAAVATASTEADGTFQLSIAQGLAANSVFYALTPGARSRRLRVRVTPTVTIAGPPPGAQLLPGARASTAARAARTVVFSGTVEPLEPGAVVVLQRESASASEDWRRIGIGEVGPDGRYAIAHGFSVAGPATVRVVVHARGLHAAASEALSYEVAPRQNPRLEIARSAATLAYGQAVGISGTAAKPGEQLTLLARARGARFAAVASTRAGAGGRYAFAAQTPLQSTYYRVAGPGASSATLFEGIEPLLSVRPSASSILAGEALRVCGTLTPARAGEPVDLQRRSPDGAGFHTIAESALAAGGGYCVEAALFAAGSQTFRVKVASTAETQAVASGPLEVAVASASELAPAEGGGEASAAPPRVAASG